MTADKTLTKDEFAEKWGWKPLYSGSDNTTLKIAKDEFLSDLNALLRAELVRFCDLMGNTDEELIDEYLNTEQQ
jgi:hypothetical protein